MQSDFQSSSESVSLPFTSIWMQSLPYHIRWSFPFSRKGNSGMLRYCKVGAFGFGENLHACAPPHFAPGRIFPQKPCIRSSLPLWGTWNENDRCDRKTHKKCRINERQISSETQLPQALGSALNIKTRTKMEKSVNIHRALRTTLRLMLTSVISIVFGAVGVVIGLLAKIIADVLRLLWTIVLYVLTLVSILALIL